MKNMYLIAPKIIANLRFYPNGEKTAFYHCFLGVAKNRRITIQAVCSNRHFAVERFQEMLLLGTSTGLYSNKTFLTQEGNWSTEEIRTQEVKNKRGTGILAAYHQSQSWQNTLNKLAF